MAKRMKFKEAIILAGGLGTRLRSVIGDIPKIMAPVNEKPFVNFVIAHFAAEGIEKFVFALGYKHEIIVDHIESFLSVEYPSLTFQYSIEEKKSGTGGAIRLACQFVDEKNVLVLNGDTLFKVDASRLAVFHFENNADCTLSLKPMKNFDRYGVVELNEDSSVKKFHEKQPYNEGLINGGVYALNAKKFFEENWPGEFSFETDYLERFYAERKIFGLIQNEHFIDIGIPEDYERAQKELR